MRSAWRCFFKAIYIILNSDPAAAAPSTAHVDIIKLRNNSALLIFRIYYFALSGNALILQEASENCSPLCSLVSMQRPPFNDAYFMARCHIKPIKNCCIALIHWNGQSVASLSSGQSDHAVVSGFYTTSQLVRSRECEPICCDGSEGICNHCLVFKEISIILLLLLPPMLKLRMHLILLLSLLLRMILLLS